MSWQGIAIRILILILGLVALYYLGIVPRTPRSQPGPTATREAGWTTAAPVPTPRTEVAAAVLDQKIYVLGGYMGNSQTVGTVERYDLATDSWEKLADLLEPVNHPAAAGFAGEIWLVGGTKGDGGRTSLVQIYTPGTNSWRKGVDLPAPRSALGVAVIGDSLFAVGGADGPSQANLYRMKAGGTVWEELAPMSEDRDHLAVATDSEKLYVIAGRKDGDFVRKLATFEIYDPALNTWTKGPDLPTARSGLAAAVVDGILLVVGGEAPTGTFDEVEGYEIASGTWETYPKLPTSRHGLGVVALDGALHVLAGGPTPGLSVTSAHEVFKFE